MPARMRKVVSIDEEKCDGCGLCAQACAEGAIRIIDGKARLVSETYCDGLGACLGKCPNDAITVEERHAEKFDERAAKAHVARLAAEKKREEASGGAKQTLPCGCPGSMARTIERHAPRCPSKPADAQGALSALGNWPVQLRLVSPLAPYFDNADLLIAADCVPFAFADFHKRFLKGRVLVIGCPKLDDTAPYAVKLAHILSHNDIKSVEVLHMEVPCCFGLVSLVENAIKESGKRIPLRLVKIGINGDVIDVTEKKS
jgi:Pyruvate/2-oxoacid:ferredoxin oxidoreductase delta subunit